MVAVEDLGREQEVQTGGPVDDVLGLYVGDDVEFLAVLEDAVGALLGVQSPVVLLEVVGEVFEEMPISLPITNILPEVLDHLLAAIHGQEVVEPPEQNILRLELKHNISILLLLLQNNQLRHTPQVDVSEDVYSDDLPDKPEHNMLLLLTNILWVHVHHHTANRLCGRDGEVEVLGLLPHVQWGFHVDGDLGDGAGGGDVHELAGLWEGEYQRMMPSVTALKMLLGSMGRRLCSVGSFLN